MSSRRGEALLLSPWRWLLLPAWLLYRPLVSLRDRVWDGGWRRPRRVPVPVLCVGNLSSGGTGKTPTVAWLGAELQALGHRPAVISRGYRGVDGSNDEARSLSLPVHCDPLRYRAALAAIAAGADCLIMDDGFQHRRLHRDLDLVCLDATRPWGRPDGRWGGTLPLGLMREGRRALRRATAILLTRSDQVPPARLAALRAELSWFPGPVLASRHAAQALRRLGEETRHPPQQLCGRPVLLASGLGNPDGFTATARDLGWQVLGHRRFPDHHPFSETEQHQLLAEAQERGAELVITAKDAARWRLPGPLVLEVALALEEPDRRRLLALVADVCGAGRSTGVPFNPRQAPLA